MEVESVEMMVMAQWMMVMMIPMKSSVMTKMMAMISPLREGISPAGSTCQRALFSLGGFCPVEAAEYFVDDPP